MSKGEAFGAPGMEPKWTSSSKEGIGTSLSDASPVWFTLAYGILNEIYFPCVDTANTRDAQYLVSDGVSFLHEEKRDMDHQFEYANSRALAFRQTNTDRQGRYRIVKETITDHHAPVVLVHTRYEALQPAASDYQVYVLVAPHIGNQGLDNTARTLIVDGRACLVAQRDGKALAVVASIPYLKCSAGFVGSSDGWTDLDDNFRMDWEFESATNGNTALTGELDIRQSREWVLAIGFGATCEDAARAAFISLDRGWRSAYTQYLRIWNAYCDSLLNLSGATGDGGQTYYTSAMVVRAHEDRSYRGAVCASLSIPWGEIHGDHDMGGYHLIWPRDLVQAASGALAAGDFEMPVRILRYLVSIQGKDGNMPQNCWVDGSPYWGGIQLDEVAFPLLLAWQLRSRGLLGGLDPYPMMKAAAGFLLRHGPATPQDRWEEDAGISVSTLAVLISALVCTADIAAERGDEAIAVLCLQTADYWASNIETWTFTTSGTLLEGHTDYYVRLDAEDPATQDSHLNPNVGYIHINNHPPGADNFYPVKDVIDGGFLELVRYGLRDAQDEHVLKTLAVYDATLMVDTPRGLAWHRYNHDGYGQKENGDAFDGTGVGRAWPLLSGERAHYEIAAGRKVQKYIRALESFANTGAMLPEQVWDSADIPEKKMYFGRPTGSAMPLVWAHAEYLKVLRSACDKSIFDQIAPVRKRYVEARITSNLQIWTFTHKLRSARRNCPLRIETSTPARLHWTVDNWAIVHEEALILEALGIHACLIPEEELREAGDLKFTFYWPEVARWEADSFSIVLD